MIEFTLNRNRNGKKSRWANELRQQALTPAILEKMWIEKWDGKLPVYGQVPTIFKDISK